MRSRTATELDQPVARTIASSWRTPEIAFTFILVGFLGAFGYNWNAVLPLLARFALDSSALGFGGLNSALGIGSLAGAMFAAGQGRTTVRALAVAATDFSVFLGLLGLAPFYLAAIVLLLAQGFWSVTFSTTANTRVQLTAPPELRGRVMGIYNLVFVGTAPLGAGLTGATVCASEVRTGASAAAAYGWDDWSTGPPRRLDGYLAAAHIVGVLWAQVLAIVANRQPIARLGIELIRRASASDSAIATLLERGLIAHNAPHLFVTTRAILEHAGAEGFRRSAVIGVDGGVPAGTRTTH